MSLDLGLLFRLIPQRDNIERIVNLVVPAWKVLQPNLPELISRIREVTAAVDPELQTQLAGEAPLAAFDVKWLQDALNKLGAQPPLRVDGVYGDGTKAAVMAFQKSHTMVIDGWAGMKTCIAIIGELAAKGGSASHIP